MTGTIHNLGVTDRQLKYLHGFTIQNITLNFRTTMQLALFCEYVMVIVMVEFNVIRASILEGWLFYPYGRTSRFGAESPAPLYYRSSNDFAITYGN